MIAGIGDLLRRDDGFGPRVIERLEKSNLPNNVLAKDYGTSLFELMLDLKDFNKVIFVDAMEFKGKAGEIKVIEPKPRKVNEEAAVRLMGVSLHEMELQKAINLAYSLKVLPRKVLVIGCKPKDLGFGLGLSREVEAAIDGAVKIILKEVYGKLK